MYDAWIFLFGCFYLILPACMANGIPAFLRKIKFLDKPIDFNFKLWEKPLFGRNKTWRGLIIGILCGVLVFVFQKYLYQFAFFQNISLINYFEFSILYGILLSAGALLGDLAGSFIKRRFNVAPGQDFCILDQIDWIMGLLLFSSLIFIPCWYAVITIILLGIIFHAGGNLVLDFLQAKGCF